MVLEKTTSEMKKVLKTDDKIDNLANAMKEGFEKTGKND